MSDLCPACREPAPCKKCVEPSVSKLRPPSTGRKMLDDAIFVAVVLVVVFIIPALFSGV